MKILDDLRAAGWTVAIHNDYRQQGKHRTFYLLTHSNGFWVKGEADSDQAALVACRDEIERCYPYEGGPPDPYNITNNRNFIELGFGSIEEREAFWSWVRKTARKN